MAYDYIDIHGHCVLESGYPLDGLKLMCEPKDLIGFYELYGVEKGVLLPQCNAENFQVQSNEEVLRIARDNPGRFIPFCNIDARACNNTPYAPLYDVIMFYRDKGCMGVGEVCNNLSILDPRVQNLFSATEKAGIPLTFHIATRSGNTYGIIDEPGLPGLERSLQEHPNLKFFGHSQAFWCEIGKYDDVRLRGGYPMGKVEEGRLAELFRKYPNLYGDLSANSGAIALSRDREYAVKFLNEFQDRLMFGMDLCQPEVERSWHAILPPFLRDLRDKGDITQEVFEKVARKNAIRILGL